LDLSAGPLPWKRKERGPSKSGSLEGGQALKIKREIFRRKQ